MNTQSQNADVLNYRDESDDVADQIPEEALRAIGEALAPLMAHIDALLEMFAPSSSGREAAEPETSPAHPPHEVSAAPPAEGKEGDARPAEASTPGEPGPAESSIDAPAEPPHPPEAQPPAEASPERGPMPPESAAVVATEAPPAAPPAPAEEPAAGTAEPAAVHSPPSDPTPGLTEHLADLKRQHAQTQSAGWNQQDGGRAAVLQRQIAELEAQIQEEKGGGPGVATGGAARSSAPQEAGKPVQRDPITAEDALTPLTPGQTAGKTGSGLRAPDPDDFPGLKEGASPDEESAAEGRQRRAAQEREQRAREAEAAAEFPGLQPPSAAPQPPAEPAPAQPLPGQERLAARQQREAKAARVQAEAAQKKQEEEAEAARQEQEKAARLREAAALPESAGEARQRRADQDREQVERGTESVQEVGPGPVPQPLPGQERLAARQGREAETTKQREEQAAARKVEEEKARETESAARTKREEDAGAPQTATGIGGVFDALASVIGQTTAALQGLTGAAGPLGAVFKSIQGVTGAFQAFRKAPAEATAKTLDARVAHDKAQAHAKRLGDEAASDPQDAAKRRAAQQAQREAGKAGKTADEAAEAESDPLGAALKPMRSLFDGAGKLFGGGKGGAGKDDDRSGKAAGKAVKAAGKVGGEEAGEAGEAAGGGIGDLLGGLLGGGGGGAAAGAGGAAAGAEGGAAAGAEAAGLAIPGLDVFVAGLMATQAAFSAVSAAVMAVPNLVMSVADSLNSMVNAAKPFVQAFAPSAILQLDQACYDLSAAIGVALLPVVNTATTTFRDIGSLVLPVAQELQGVFAQLSSMIRGMVMPVAESIASGFTAAVGAIDVVVNAFSFLSDGMSAAMAVVNAVMIPTMNALSYGMKVLEPAFLALSAMFTGFSLAVETVAVVFQALAQTVQEVVSIMFPAVNMRGEFDAVKNAMRDLAKQTLVAVAMLAKMAGLDSFVKQLQNVLAGPKKTDTVGLGAARNAQITGFADLGKQLALRASIASGTGPATDKEEDFRVKALAALNGLPGGDVLRSMIQEGATQMAKEVLAGMGRVIRDALPPSPTHVIAAFGEATGILPPGTRKNL